MSETEHEDLQTQAEPEVEDFDFEHAVETISIEIEANQRKNGVLTTVNVVHLFRAPTSKEVDQYRRLLSKVRGRSVKTDFSGAANYFWGRCIVKVDGYKNLPEIWKQFFLTDSKAQIHVQSAIDALLEVVMPSAEASKN